MAIRAIFLIRTYVDRVDKLLPANALTVHLHSLMEYRWRLPSCRRDLSDCGSGHLRSQVAEQPGRGQQQSNMS